MLTFHSASFDESSWEPFLAHIRGVAANFRARSWAACLGRSERSQQCAASGGRYHGHAYFIWTDGAGIQVRGLDAFAFRGSRPAWMYALPAEELRFLALRAGRLCVDIGTSKSRSRGACFAETNYAALSSRGARPIFLHRPASFSVARRGKAALSNYILMWP